MPTYSIFSALGLAALGGQSGSFWIGARRRAACQTQRITADCTAQNSFEWTDDTVTGTDGFVWNDKQPDNSDLNSGCAVLLASGPPVQWGNGMWAGAKLDDHVCDFVDKTPANPRRIRGYICGKRSN